MNVLRRLRMKAGAASFACALAAVLTLDAGQAVADEWQVRMPVQKTARIAPLADPADAQNASAPAQPGTSAPKAAPKTALGRAAEAAAVAKSAAKPGTAKPAADKSLAEKTAADAPAAPVAAKPEAKAAADKHVSAKPGADKMPADKNAAAAAAAAVVKPAAEPASPDKSAKSAAAPTKDTKASAPATSKAPKPAPVAAIDPKASVLPPAASASPTPLALPGDGKWVGDVRVEFQAESIILHAATNAAVERVTWFNLADPDGPRKLAVDLRGPWRKKGASVLRFETGPVKSVVVGEHDDRLRLSVEFRAGAVAKELSPVLERGPQGLSLTIPLAVRLAS
ncbi:hypothetical protein [Humidesulfovibrio sp.]